MIKSMRKFVMRGSLVLPTKWEDLNYTKLTTHAPNKCQLRKEHPLSILIKFQACVIFQLIKLMAHLRRAALYALSVSELWVLSLIWYSMLLS